MIDKNLLNIILKTYRLPLNGIHGISHWARVLENGRKIAEDNGADIEVISLFAIFHDSKRIDEGTDYDHGPRAAGFVYKIKDEYLNHITEIQFEQLYEACRDHTQVKTNPDITVQTCWDADRLDLGRVGIYPAKHKLCTKYARREDVIEWADERAANEKVPDFVKREWNL